jgi:murein L,D-transpeptidase YafK
MLKFINMKATLIAVIFIVCTSYNTPNTNYLILVDKTDFETTVYKGYEIIMRFQCTFGNNTLAKKEVQGDNGTPEGTYKINAKYPHEKWNKFLSVDYPNDDDRKEFYTKKQQGLLPANAKLGGSIGIHGTWPGEDWVIDRKQCWTMGCVSVKNLAIDSLYNLMPIGTKVVIKK